MLTESQLKAINEEVAMFTYDDSSQNGFLPSLNRAKENNPGANVFHGYNASETPKQQTSTDDPDQASTAGEYIGNGDNGNSATNTIGESRFSKRQVELGRMLEMRRTGKVFSKKQLNEMFMETDIAEKIKDCPAFDVMTTFGSVFGDDAEREMMDQFSAGGNPTDFIVSVYNEASEEDQDLFREKLGI